MNFFKLYNIPEQFQVDLAQLAITYQKLAQLTHPDKFAAGSESEKLAAVQKNAQVNDGYQVLKKPLSRAEHILELRGVELRHEQRTMQDPAFLMQQMEWREQLEELDVSSDPVDVLEDLDDEINNQIKAHLKSLEELLNDNTSEQDNKAADEVRKLKFLYKLLHEIELKEETLADV